MEETNTEQLSTDVLWQCSACFVGSGMPSPALFTLWPKSGRRSSNFPGSSSPKSAGKKSSVSALSIGAMCSPTPGTVLC
eukprot:11246796-Ditylum_brightwellii.AAC.1